MQAFLQDIFMLLTFSVFYLGWKDIFLFNNTLNTFYLQLYDTGHIMVKDHSDNDRGNSKLPHRLLFPISSKGSFICIIPQTG